MNFVIYEDDKNIIDEYKKAIFNVMSYSKLFYQIIEIESYRKNLINSINKIDGNKIFILDVEVPGKNGIDFAREIRNSGDWLSPIIMVTNHEEFRLVGYTAKILMLDFILKKDDYKKELINTIAIALKINSQQKSYCFSFKGEVYQIPYNDILYIEKNLNDNTSYVYTEKSKYLIRKSIVKIEKDFKDEDDFVKTHRSCIVNLKQVKSIDFESNIISFENKKINLLSRSNKKELKIRMGVKNDD